MSGLTCWPQRADSSLERNRRARAQAKPPPGDAPRKALYLDGRAQPIDVRTLGPALAIAKGAQRFTLPLARLARIVVCGKVHWDSTAMAACLQHGLPIVFLDGRARPVGAAAPLTGRSSTLDELLAAWVDRRHWREGWDNWLRAQRFRLLRHWARHRAQGGRPVDAGEWTEKVRSFVYLAEADCGGPNPGGSYALVVALLLRAGVRLHYHAADGGVLSPANALAHLVGGRAALDLGRLAPAIAVEEAMATRATETNSPDLEQYVVDLLARLRRNLADRIEPCP